MSPFLFIFPVTPQSCDVLKLKESWPTGHKRKFDRETWNQGLGPLPEMQLHLDGSLGGAAVPRRLKNTAEDICQAGAGLLPGIAGVKSHHGMGNQVNGLGLVGKALIEQFTFLEVESEREKADKILNSSISQNYLSSRQRNKVLSIPENYEGE